MGRGGEGLTVVECADGVQTGAGAHEHNAAAVLLRLHVVHCEGGGVDDAVQVYVHGCRGGREGVASGVDFERHVVCARADAGVCEDEVDAAMARDCGFEQRGQGRPLAHVGLDEGKGTSSGRGLDVGADYGGAEREEEVDCCEADA